MLVGLDAGSFRIHACLLFDSRPENARHLAGDLVLYGEDIAGRPIKGIGPQVRLVGDANQLGDNSERASGPLYRALEHRPDAQLLSNGCDVDVLALVVERRGS